MSPLAVISIVGTIFSILLHGGHRSVVEKRFRKNLFVADNGRPGRVASQAGEVILARLGMKMRGADLGLFATEFRLLSNTARAATVLGGLLGRGRGPIRLRGCSFSVRGYIGTLNLIFSLRRLARWGGFLGLGLSFLLVVDSIGASCRTKARLAHFGRTETGSTALEPALSRSFRGRQSIRSSNSLPAGFS